MGFENLSIVLGILAGVVQIFGYVVYIARAKEHINVGSWSIWALGGLVDLASYFVLTDGDWVLNVLPTACAIAAISVFTWALAKKRFSKPDRAEWSFIGIDGLVTVVWFYTNAAVASILFQVSAFLSFVPMWRGQLAEKEQEDPLAWLVWTVSYSLLTVSVLIRFEQWEEIVYPASHVLMHGAVAAIAVTKIRKLKAPR